MRLPEYKIYDFVKSKEAWIQSRRRQIEQNRYINQDVLTYNTFYFLGEELRPLITDQVKKVTKNGGVLYIPHKFATEGDAFIIKKIEKFLRDNAKVIVQERVEYFSTKLQLAYSTASTNNNKSRWGSCDKDGKISINWRAVMLPPQLFDYIIVHEFCHLLEFNHSKQFWAIVETILPNWKSIRRHLKQMNWLIGLFRPN